MVSLTTSLLTPPRRYPDEITAVLTARIAAGQYPQDGKLPSTRELAEEFGVSPPIVREALSRLKYDGLIEPRQGSGVYVRSKVATTSLRLGEHDEMAERGLQSETLEMRLHVDQACAALAAERRTNVDLTRLRSELQAMSQAVATGTDGIAADVRFHIAIAQASHNRQLVRLVEYLHGTLRDSVRQARMHSDRIAGHPQAAQREHEAIFRAVEAGHPERARRAVQRHMEGAAARLGLHIGPTISAKR